MPRINRDDIDRLHEYGIHVPTRTIVLDSSHGDGGEDDGVNHVFAARAIKNLRLLEHASDDPITLVLNTVGGSVADGMAVYDALRTSPCYIMIYVYGQASSMGSVLLQAADQRWLAPHASVMFHVGTADGVSGVSPYEAEAAARHERQAGERVDRVLLARIRERHPAFTQARFAKLNLRGRYLHAEEAIDLGLADQIIR